MMKKTCFIVEDLLPLYTEGLLSSETEEWVDAHIASCSACRALAQLVAEPMTEEVPVSPIDHEKMMLKIHLKISLYQLIFIGISFFLALQTTLMNDSFGFILSYTVLGALLYLFYKNSKIVVVITFLPVFFWSVFTQLSEVESLFVQNIFQSIIGSVVIASIHVAFALVGVFIGYLLLKIKESEGVR